MAKGGKKGRGGGKSSNSPGNKALMSDWYLIYGGVLQGSVIQTSIPGGTKNPGSPPGDGGGVQAYTVSAQALDPAAGNYYRAGATRWGPSDGDEFSLVTWFKVNHESSASSEAFVMENQTFANCKVSLTLADWKSSPTSASCAVNFTLKSSGGGTIFAMTSSGFGTHGFKAFEWVPLFFSVRLDGSPVARAYLGNTSIYATPGTMIEGTIDLNGAVAPQIGVAATGDATPDFDISTTWIDDSYIDFSLQGNRDKFMDANLRPKNLGGRGQKPTGSLPLHYNANGDLTDNKGTEADWTEVGTVGTATTSPTEVSWYYADLATAVASGDNWQNNDIISADNVHFIYLSALDVGGHSGLTPRKAMTFDGSTGYYSDTYTSSGNKVTLVARFNRASFTGGGAESIGRANGDATSNLQRAHLRINSSDHATAGRRNKIQITVNNSSGPQICNLFSSSDLADSDDHVLFFEFDGDAGTAVFRVDGVDEDDTGNAERVAPTAGTLASGATSEFFVGASEGTLFYGGEIGYVGMRDIGGLDFNDFMTGSTPKQLDESSWTEWGAQPLYWNHEGLMTDNKGSAGDMTANGTITGPDPV